uniref:Thioredoxin-like fold domain-containing protein n=1 Tax=Attheya septentrionalis TaxID=420275 RepID=A0A7S2UTD3_9STRA
MSFPKAHPGLRIGQAGSELLCEMFVDFACPYSRKLFRAVTDKSLLSKYDDKICFVFHNVIQPWHHQSLWMHETSFAVKMMKPSAQLAFWEKLFEEAPNYYDSQIFTLSRPEFYDKMAVLAADACCDDGSEKDTFKKEVLQWLIPPKQPGGNFPEAAKALGSSPDDDENALCPLTRQSIKFHRKRGVHVTPTVFFNGIEQGNISSSWSGDQWKEFLDGAL